MFYTDQSNEQKVEYEKFLRTVGCLSNLFSDSDVPYLYYRVAEKMFCRAFEADDLSRSDVSADAKKAKIGIGLKTFLANNNNTLQKVAEFNGDRESYFKLKPEKLVKKIAELRNARIDFTENLHGLEGSIYHCVLRESGKFKIFEESMDRVDIDNIKIVKVNKGSIVFKDGINEYSFLLSKSTLQKRFVTDEACYEFDVEILKDPIQDLAKLLSEEGLLMEDERRFEQSIYLPLYGSNQTVYTKSGLNQWNADDTKRKRNRDEVYIPVPAIVHKKFPTFFPSRKVTFLLKFPDGEKVESSICQGGGKALMTKSNTRLGKLILRDGLKLKEGELATYEKLQQFGIDSVRIDKISNSEFEINFAKNGSYENFIKG